MWIKVRSKKRDKDYFYNTISKESVWERPNTGYRIYHILIKHNKSRNPDNGVTEEEAYDKITQIIKELKEDREQPTLEVFKEKALKHSKCSSAKRGGDLGMIVGNEMLKEFEDIAFSLEENEFKGPVATPSGIHIIYRAKNE